MEERNNTDNQLDLHRRSGSGREDQAAIARKRKKGETSPRGDDNAFRQHTSWQRRERLLFVGNPEYYEKWEQLPYKNFK